jgi:hypothetical protein
MWRACVPGKPCGSTDRILQELNETESVSLALRSSASERETGRGRQQSKSQTTWSFADLVLILERNEKTLQGCLLLEGFFLRHTGV